jgi:hypothetical protein
MDTTMTPSKHHRSPASSVSSTEGSRKKHGPCNTPEQGNTKDNTISPDTVINLPPQAGKKTGSHVTSYKDTLTNLTTNKEEADGDVDSDASSYNNASYSTTETLTTLQRTQQLSNNILTSKKDQNKEDSLTCSSSESSSSDVTGNTIELLEEFRKNKSTLTRKDTTPHTLSNNKLLSYTWNAHRQTDRQTNGINHSNRRTCTCHSIHSHSNSCSYTNSAFIETIQTH